MQMFQVKIESRDDDQIWIHQDDQSDGSTIQLSVEQVPLICAWLLDAAGFDAADVPKCKANRPVEV